MTTFWNFFLKKDHFTFFLIAVLVVGGVFSLIAIPKESSPEVAIPVGVVATALPGASSEDVERLVTNKIEDQVLGLERVSKVTSVSAEGISIVTVEFDASANIEKSIQLLKDEVDEARSELPAEVVDPTVTDVNFADQPIIIASISGELAPAELTKLGTTLQDELKRIPGVSKVELSGVRERQVQVVIEQTKLRQYNLSVSDITNAIKASGLAAPIGSISVSDVRYAVRLEAGVTTPEEVGAIALSGPGGTVLHVRDVANVVNGLEDPTTFSRVSVAGSPSKPALTLSVYKNRGGNIIDVGTAVTERLDTLQASTLSGTKYVVSYDASNDVKKDLYNLTRAGIETIILVMIILYFTLGPRESIVAALSVPLSFLIAFIGLYTADNTINFISLFSLILAIGILVDLGIVVVEAFHTHLRESQKPREAALASIREYAWPLIAGTFTTIAVFFPLFFLSGIVGKFIAGIPFTVIFVLIASIFVALGLVPLISVYAVHESHSSMGTRQEAINIRTRTAYVKFLQGFLGNKKKEKQFLVGMIVLFLISLTLPFIGVVKVVFFPGEDSDLIYLEVEEPQGSGLATTDIAVREIEELLYDDTRISSFVSGVGSGSAFSQNVSNGSNIANITINLTKGHKQTGAEIVSTLQEEITEHTRRNVRVSELSGGPPSGAPVEVTFSGNDSAKLSTIVERAAQILADIPGTTNIVTSTKDDGAEFVVRLDTARAAELGVSAFTVSETLRTALYGTEATTIRSGNDDIEVHTKLDLNTTYKDPSETTYTSIDSVRDLTVIGSRGPVPLSAIATIEYTSANSSVRHENGTRVAKVTSGVSSSGNALTISNALEKRIQEEGLPEEVTMRVGGDNEDVNKSFAEMGVALIAGVALMLAILMLEFNSLRQSAYLLSIIPLSLTGVFFGLMVTRQPLSFPSMLGVIALSGVIVNHAILLMDSISRIGRSHPDQTLKDTVIEACATRLRPILLTTVVTVAGMVPLSFVSSLWGPLAFAVMFGLAFSLLLTLVLIPVLYTRWPGKRVLRQFENRNR
jgi:multidrug efflux pump subunit AcrB